MYMAKMKFQVEKYPVKNVGYLRRLNDGSFWKCTGLTMYENTMTGPEE